MKRMRKLITCLLCTLMIVTNTIPVFAAEQTPIAVQLPAQTPVYVAPKIDPVTLINYYIKNLDVQGYMKKNPDLVTVFGEDIPMYILHYVLCGIPEGRRTATWDPVAFVINNGDKIGQSILEGKTDFFDIEKYKKTYPHLVALYGDDGSKYLAHYLTEGILAGEVSGGKFDAVTFAKNFPDAVAKTNVTPTEFAKVVKAEQNNKIVASSSTSNTSNSSGSSESSSSSGSSDSSDSSGSSKPSEDKKDVITKFTFKTQQDGDKSPYEVEITNRGISFENEDDLYFDDLWDYLWSDYTLSIVAYSGDKVKGTYIITAEDFKVNDSQYKAVLTLNEEFLEDSFEISSDVVKSLIVDYTPSPLEVEDGVIDNYVFYFTDSHGDVNERKITRHAIKFNKNDDMSFTETLDSYINAGYKFEIIAYSGETELYRKTIKSSNFEVDTKLQTATVKLGTDLFGEEVRVNEKAPSEFVLDYSVEEVVIDNIHFVVSVDDEVILDKDAKDGLNSNAEDVNTFEDLWDYVFEGTNVELIAYQGNEQIATVPVKYDDFDVENDLGKATLLLTDKFTDFEKSADLPKSLVITFQLADSAETELNEYGDYKDSTYSNKFVKPTISFTDLNISYELPCKLSEFIEDGWFRTKDYPWADIKVSSDYEDTFLLEREDSAKEILVWVEASSNCLLSEAYVVGIQGAYEDLGKTMTVNGYDEFTKTKSEVSSDIQANSSKPGDSYISRSSLTGPIANIDETDLMFTYDDNDTCSEICFIGDYKKTLKDTESAKDVLSSEDFGEIDYIQLGSNKITIGSTVRNLKSQGYILNTPGFPAASDKNAHWTDELAPKATHDYIIGITDTTSDKKSFVEIAIVNDSSMTCQAQDCPIYKISEFQDISYAYDYNQYGFIKAYETSYQDVINTLGYPVETSGTLVHGDYYGVWRDIDSELKIYFDENNTVSYTSNEYTGNRSEFVYTPYKLITNVEALRLEETPVDISLTPTYDTNTAGLYVADYWDAYLNGNTAVIRITYVDDTTEDITLDISDMVKDEDALTATATFDEDFLGQYKTLADSLDTEFVFSVNVLEEEVPKQPDAEGKIEITKLEFYKVDSSGDELKINNTVEHSISSSSSVDFEACWNAYLDNGSVIVKATVASNVTAYTVELSDFEIAEDQSSGTFTVTADKFGADYILGDGVSAVLTFSINQSE